MFHFGNIPTRMVVSEAEHFLVFLLAPIFQRSVKTKDSSERNSVGKNIHIYLNVKNCPSNFSINYALSRPVLTRHKTTHSDDIIFWIYLCWLFKHNHILLIETFVHL